MNKGYLNLYIVYWFQYWRSFKTVSGDHRYTAAQAYDMVINDLFVDEADVCLG